MQKSEKLFVLISFILWRIIIFLPILLSPFVFELQKNFLGGGMQNYLSNPFLWAWANFDGEHYLSIAKLGYGNGEQAFFPLYPLLLKILGGSVFSGLLISNGAFLIALFGLYKLVRLDFDEEITKLTILLLLLFPTSFFFGALYTESLFLVFVVWGMFFVRKERFLLGNVLGALSSATRIVGVVFTPIYLINLYIKKKLSIKNMSIAGISLLGSIAYMLYSYKTWGDPIKFFNTASGFGEQRSDHLILLPQVFYRYFVKIIPNLSFNYFPVVFVTFLEISVAILFLWVILTSFKKMNINLWLFLFLSYLIPTFSGSFSSLPRYVLISFPAFLVFALSVKKIPQFLKFSLYFILAAILFVTEMLFVRGYFVS